MVREGPLAGGSGWVREEACWEALDITGDPSEEMGSLPGVGGGGLSPTGGGGPPPIGRPDLPDPPLVRDG
jgi:hypothetical protein